jgi:hypothetical protein
MEGRGGGGSLLVLQEFYIRNEAALEAVGLPVRLLQLLLLLASILLEVDVVQAGGLAVVLRGICLC